MGNVTCLCDQHFDSWAEHATHVAALILEALAASGFAVVQLPAPDEHGEWFLSDAWGVWLDRGGRVQIRTQGYGLPNETRAFAAALLAAADAAASSPVGLEGETP
jgi:hypothetical protein